MVTRVQKWGNSQGLRFTKTLLDEARINVGDEVNISIRKGRIIVEPVAKVRGRYDLKTLVAKCRKRISLKNRTGDLPWGKRCGRCPHMFRKKGIS